MPREKRPFLYSLDDRGFHKSLLVQSTQAPTWDTLEIPDLIRVKTFEPEKMPVGTELQFFLRANPTVDRQGYLDGKKRRIAVGSNRELLARRRNIDIDDVPSREDLLVEWMDRKGASGGFKVLKCTPGPTVERSILRPGDVRARKPPMTIHEVEFSGLLRTEDPSRFAATCAGGIGRARAFGYGLLMIRPA